MDTFEARVQHLKDIRDMIAKETAIVESMKAGRLTYFNNAPTEGEARDETPGMIAHGERTIAMLNAVIERFYGDVS